MKCVSVNVHYVSIQVGHTHIDAEIQVSSWKFFLFLPRRKCILKPEKEEDENDSNVKGVKNFRYEMRVKLMDRRNETGINIWKKEWMTQRKEEKTEEKSTK